LGKFRLFLMKVAIVRPESFFHFEACPTACLSGLSTIFPIPGQKSDRHAALLCHAVALI
jgi:hypothetical protein